MKNSGITTSGAILARITVATNQKTAIQTHQAVGKFLKKKTASRKISRLTKRINKLK